ncbi:hypothetical protein D3C72_1668760 [compost metagenome]
MRRLCDEPSGPTFCQRPASGARRGRGRARPELQRPPGPGCRAGWRQRCRQDDDGADDRGRPQASAGPHRVRRHEHRRTRLPRRGRTRHHTGAGGAPGFPANDGRGEPANGCAQSPGLTQLRTQSGAGLCAVPASGATSRPARRRHVRWRTADAGDRARPDGRATSADPR